MPFLTRRHHFIGDFREEALFHRVNLGGRWWSFFVMSKTNLEVCLSFIYGPCSTWRTDHLDQVVLLVWPNR